MRLRELMRHYSPCAVLTDSCDGRHRRDEGIAVTYRQAPLKRLARYECANVAPLQWTAKASNRYRESSCAPGSGVGRGCSCVSESSRAAATCLLSLHQYPS